MLDSGFSLRLCPDFLLEGAVLDILQFDTPSCWSVTLQRQLLAHLRPKQNTSTKVIIIFHSWLPRSGAAFCWLADIFFMSLYLLFCLSKCHYVFVLVFCRNRKNGVDRHAALVNNIYIYVQTGSYFWITRRLLHQKQAVSDLETTLFFYWNNGFFVLIGTKTLHILPSSGVTPYAVGRCACTRKLPVFAAKWF